MQNFDNLPDAREDPTAPGKPYVCSLCGGEFLGERTQEECLREAEDNGMDVNDKLLVLCDDCYQRVMAWHDGTLN